MVHVIGLQERVAYHTCCFIAHTILTRGISGLLAAPAMTQDAEHKLTILDACSYVGIVTSNTWKSASTSLQLLISMVSKTILLWKPLPCSESFTGRLKVNWAGHSITALVIFHSVSTQGCRIAISLFRDILKLFRTDNRALKRCFCKFVAHVPPGKAGKTEFVKFHTHPDLWATCSSRLSLSAATSFPEFASLSPHPKSYMSHGYIQQAPSRPYHGQYCPAPTLGFCLISPTTKNIHRCPPCALQSMLPNFLITC